jgi:anti-sigma regulatory factor (Ser/Thr protein kinase)
MSCHAVQRARSRPEPIGTGAHLRLESKPSNVGAARRFVEEQMAGYKEATVDDASLLVTELATNAIVHVGTSFVVGVIADETEVLIAVADDRHDRVPLLGRMPAAEDIVEMSRGIAIVSLVASDFGWHLLADSPGKVVWFALGRGTRGDAAPRNHSRRALWSR